MVSLLAHAAILAAFAIKAVVFSDTKYQVPPSLSLIHI